MKQVSLISAYFKLLKNANLQKRGGIAFIAFVSFLSLAHLNFSKRKDLAGSIRPLFPDDGVKRSFSSEDANSRIDTNFVIRKTAAYYPSYNYTDNYGNKIWQYAANEILPDFSDAVMCSNKWECSKIAEKSNRKTKVLLYHPAANNFNSWFQNALNRETKAMEENDESVLIIGAGVQLEYFNDTALSDLNPGHAINRNVNDFRFTQNATAFLKALNARKMPAVFRGDFTWRAAKLAGYDYGISLGCPSLLINPSINLGQTLKKKYQALKQRIGDRSLRIALNVQWFQSPKVMDMSYWILREYPNSVAYAQNITEAEHLYQNGIPIHRVRLYAYADDWIHSMRAMDLSIGIRIHGNMAGLAAEIPVLVIAPDHRVLELVQRMLIPHVMGVDERLVTDFDVAELVSTADFDADAFDLNRCATARTYQNLFRRFGLDVKEPISELAKSCQ